MTKQTPPSPDPPREKKAHTHQHAARTPTPKRPRVAAAASALAHALLSLRAAATELSQLSLNRCTFELISEYLVHQARRRPCLSSRPSDPLARIGSPSQRHLHLQDSDHAGSFVLFLTCLCPSGHGRVFRGRAGGFLLTHASEQGGQREEVVALTKLLR